MSGLKSPKGVFFLRSPGKRVDWLTSTSFSAVDQIEGGRHPVAEHELRKKGTDFIANDTLLDTNSLLHIVTGPNM